MKNESQLAKRLLKLKESGYPSPWTVIFGRKRGHFVRYIALSLLLFGLISVWNDIPMRCYVLLLLGFLAGMFTKEAVFMSKIRKSWPFSVKITDWSIVAEIADEQIGEQSGASNADRSAG